MNIKELVEKYYHMGDVVEMDLLDFPNNPINNITKLNNIGNDARMFTSSVKHLAGCKHATTICIDDTLDMLYEHFLHIIRPIQDPVEKHETGFGMVHIKGVGYIITKIKDDISYYLEYTLEEYEELMSKYILLGIAKQESHYLKDWVRYHLRIGFDKIYLIDNNDAHGERYEELLQEYIKDGRLEIIYMRGKRCIQVASYNLFYQILPFKYMAIVDVDEYIWFNERGNYTDIKTFLDATDFGNKYGMMLQWHCYESSGDDKPSDLPIWEVNNRLCPYRARKDSRPEYIHQWVKSIYKKGYRIVSNEHFGWSPDDIYVNMIFYDGRPMTVAELQDIPEDEFMNQEVFVKHFLLRNINDFYWKKYRRGHAGLEDTVDKDGWHFYQWLQNINYFTDISDNITEKEQIFLRERGMKMNYTFHPDVYINYYQSPCVPYVNNLIRNTLAKDTLNIVNAFFRGITIEYDKKFNIQQPQPDSLTPEIYDIGFMDDPAWGHIYMDTGVGANYIKVYKNIQDPIIINIGLPLSFFTEEVSIQAQYNYTQQVLSILQSNNLRTLLRKVLDEGQTIIPQACCVDNTPDALGWKDALEEFLQQLGLSLPPNYLLCNTMILPYKQWLKLKDFQRKFMNYFGVIDNNFIIENAKDRITTPYHAYMASMMSVIENPYYVWST